VLVIGLPATQLMRRRPEDFGLLPDGQAPVADGVAGASGERQRGSVSAEPSFTARQALRTPAF